MSYSCVAHALAGYGSESWLLPIRILAEHLKNAAVTLQHPEMAMIGYTGIPVSPLISKAWVGWREVTDDTRFLDEGEKKSLRYFVE